MDPLCEARLDQFLQRCLRRILGIKREDHVTNIEVLERTEMTAIQTILASKRLRWLGHVDRLPNHRLPKQILYGELCQGSRPLGCPLKRYKDTCKKDLQAFRISVNEWRELAQKRPAFKVNGEDRAS